MAKKVYQKLPASEAGPNSVHSTTAGEVFWVTRNPKNNQFTLWKAVEGGYEKQGTAKSPLKLYDRINW